MSDKSSKNSGIGFVGLLTIAFIVLKLVGTIDWSWWWVLSPLWIGLAISISIMLIGFIVLWMCNCNAKRKIKRLLK